MKKVINTLIPFKGFLAMAIWPIIFIRRELYQRYTEKTDRHEHTHGRQQVEMLAVGVLLSVILACIGCSWWSILPTPIFYYCYLAEFLLRFAKYRSRLQAYRNISFEREAYFNQSNVEYLKERKLFAWTKYIFLKKAI